MANVFDKITGTEHVVAESSLLKATVAGHIYSLEMIADTDNGRFFGDIQTAASFLFICTTSIRSVSLCSSMYSGVSCCWKSGMLPRYLARMHTS